MDAAVLRDNTAFECCFESARRAWRGSAEGVMLDAQVYAEPWGFKLEDVDVPVRLWHGKQDRAFSFRIAEEVAQQLPIVRRVSSMEPDTFRCQFGTFARYWPI